MYHQFLLSKKNSITKQIASLEQKIANMPDYELSCVKNGKYTKWFQYNNSERIYISRKNRSLAEILAQKKLFTAQLLDLKAELILLEKFTAENPILLSNHQIDLLSFNAYKELLAPYLNTHSDYINQWLHADRITGSIHPENLIHKTLSGHCVRSKSEVIIANTLFLNKIPFIYECGLSLDGNLFFPDFTICHPQSYQIIYWEHFGMMDNASYCDHSYNKLKTYGYHGIIPSINLITTYETKEHPLNSAQIEQLVWENFLV